MLKHCILSVDYSEKWEKIFDHLPGIIKLLGVQRLSLTHVSRRTTDSGWRIMTQPSPTIWRRSASAYKPSSILRSIK